MKKFSLEDIVKYVLLGLLIYWGYTHIHFESGGEDSPEPVAQAPSGSVCPGCKGSGVIYIRCPTCRGTGIYAVNSAIGEMLTVCKNCSGEGRIFSNRPPKKCAACGGVGWIKSRHAEDDAALCRECFGTGESQETDDGLCAECKGTGYVVLTGVKGIKCSDCLGSGKKAIACVACNGTGKRI